MPNYYNPYNFYPASYQMGQASFAPYVNQPMMQQSASAQPKCMEWVEGEVGAKAFQMPQGWPANQPIPLWDSTDTVIYLKSWNPMGMTNPMQKIHYTMEEQRNLPVGTSGQMSAAEGLDPSKFVTKDDFESLKTELRELVRGSQTQNNQNGNNSQQNGGRR